MRDEPLEAASEHVLREVVPRVLGAVIRRFGDFAAAEDAVQEALLAATVEWRRGGVPDNPGGWLFRIACRRMADHVDSERSRRRRESVAMERVPREFEPTMPDESPELARDDTLILLFTCGHPALTPASAIALTLRAVGGLTTAEIARAFLVPEATMAQRISRAKRAIEDSGVAFELPGERERVARLRTVLHVLYLMFDEGYASTSGHELQRNELSTEAIRLARLLHGLLPGVGEVTGLLALMLLTHARSRARSGPTGELVPLDEQDRSLWDRRAIEEGARLVTASFAAGSVGAYQLQAAIAALHDEAPRWEDTDWPQILALYEVLARMADNPMVALNRAIAVAMVRGPSAGLALLDALRADARLANTHRLEAARAHLLERAGDRAGALESFRNAALRADNDAERAYLEKKAARVAGG